MEDVSPMETNTCGKFTISLIKGLRLTATHKRAIALLLERGWMDGHSRLTEYRILPVADGIYKVAITKAERDERNQLQQRTMLLTIRATARTCLQSAA
uniref:Uncharacterized protein n=1 Tax=Ochrobactrum sp. LM19 TaxID=1449781 RepID=A0A0D5A1H4_9HYPH|nr:hypothetical protein [Ochrobactrum sp. LM19]AJW30031.1 hypothetical protein pLM19O2_p86 [Ochrobactrum sp. LM19]